MNQILTLPTREYSAEFLNFYKEVLINLYKNPTITKHFFLRSVVK